MAFDGPQAWFDKFTNKSLELGLVGSYVDAYLFIRLENENPTHVLIYVNSIILNGNDTIFFRQLIHQLGRHYAMKDLGPIHMSYV